jgi:hypothetical protein
MFMSSCSQHGQQKKIHFSHINFPPIKPQWKSVEWTFIIIKLIFSRSMKASVDEFVQYLSSTAVCFYTQTKVSRRMTTKKNTTKFYGRTDEQRAINQFINMKNDINHWHWSNICCLLRVATAKTCALRLFVEILYSFFIQCKQYPQKPVRCHTFIQRYGWGIFPRELNCEECCKDQWIVKSDLTLQLFVIHLISFTSFFGQQRELLHMRQTTLFTDHRRLFIFWKWQISPECRFGTWHRNFEILFILNKQEAFS